MVSLKDIAEEQDVRLETVHNHCVKLNIHYIKDGIKRYIDEKDVPRLLEHIANGDPVQIPEGYIPRYQAIEKAGISSGAFDYRARTLNIKPHIVEKRAYYTDEQIVAIQKVTPIVEKKSEKLEELKKAKPWITDDRCFDMNWWPYDPDTKEWRI